MKVNELFEAAGPIVWSSAKAKEFAKIAPPWGKTNDFTFAGQKWTCSPDNQHKRNAKSDGWEANYFGPYDQHVDVEWLKGAPAIVTTGRFRGNAPARRFVLSKESVLSNKQEEERDTALYMLGLKNSDTPRGKPGTDENIAKAVLKAYQNAAHSISSIRGDIIQDMSDFKLMWRHLKASGWSNPELEGAINRSLAKPVKPAKIEQHA